MRPAFAEQVAKVLEGVEVALGSEIVGAYLYGSAVRGGLRPGSDIDIFVVTRRTTTPPKRRQLVGRLMPISNRRLRPAGWRPVELTVVVQSEVRPWRYPLRMDFQYGEWLREDFERGELDLSSPINPDLAVLIAMVLLADHPLFGPPPAEVLDAVPRRDLTRAMVDGIDSLLADIDSDSANVVLTFARIWSTLATDTFRSKDEAADWVLPRLPAEHRPVLAWAQAIYRGEEDVPWRDVHGLRSHADYVLAQIRDVATEHRAGER